MTAVLRGFVGMLIDLPMTGTFYMGGLAGLGTLGLLLPWCSSRSTPTSASSSTSPAGWSGGAGRHPDLQLLGYRYLVDLHTFLLGLLLTALVARSLGLMSEGAGCRTCSFKVAGATPRSQRPAGPTVVQGPWQPPMTPPVSRDQAALDALLDKISESGMESLTDGEREQLMILRDRLRRR